MQSDNTKRPLKYRKLRIAWSVFWGVACVLLIVMWDRGLWRQYYLFSHIAKPQSLYVSSHEGNLGVKVVSLNLQPRSDYIAAVPFSWLFLLIVGLTAAPWIPWHFSLRTLLIATTLVAAVLGTIVYAVR